MSARPIESEFRPANAPVDVDAVGNDNVLEPALLKIIDALARAAADRHHAAERQEKIG